MCANGVFAPQSQWTGWFVECRWTPLTGVLVHCVVSLRFSFTGWGGGILSWLASQHFLCLCLDRIPLVWLLIVWMCGRNTMRVVFLLGLLVICGLKALFICFWLYLFFLKLGWGTLFITEGFGSVYHLERTVCHLDRWCCDLELRWRLLQVGYDKPCSPVSNLSSCMWCCPDREGRLCPLPPSVGMSPTWNFWYLRQLHTSCPCLFFLDYLTMKRKVQWSFDTMGTAHQETCQKTGIIINAAVRTSSLSSQA
jgi:hypothetical protein